MVYSAPTRQDGTWTCSVVSRRDSNCRGTSIEVRVWDGCVATIISVERHVEWLYVNFYFVYRLNIGLFAGCFEVCNGFNV